MYALSLRESFSSISLAPQLEEEEEEEANVFILEFSRKHPYAAKNRIHLDHPRHTRKNRHTEHTLMEGKNNWFTTRGELTARTTLSFGLVTRHLPPEEKPPTTVSQTSVGVRTSRTSPDLDLPSPHRTPFKGLRLLIGHRSSLEAGAGGRSHGH